MESQPKKWYSRWWFALLILLLGFALGMLFKGSWMDVQSGVNC